MQKPNLPQTSPPAHATRRDAGTEPGELKVIVPTHPPDLSPGAARALLHLLANLATKPL
ncbi:hypothetical protein [Nocardia coubleae]|uniref:Uncharacterized protein n=1 Tax=Nocardia coubleae TaxID=356147 RepID=A0A846VZ49_9NOCA|nr:hypothetical protein [Nocardia coubleae]NKX86109.1 hypothetical protein [Nocardia coubleae]